jgi:hypothetical protein
MAKSIIRNRFSLIWLVTFLFLALSARTRIALLVSTHASGVTTAQFTGSFFIGILYDLSVSAFIIIPFVLQVWLRNDFIYRKKVLPFVCAFFVCLLTLLLFTSINLYHAREMAAFQPQ